MCDTKKRFEKPGVVSVLKGVFSFGIYNVYLHHQYEEHNKQFRIPKLPVYDTVEILINDKYFTQTLRPTPETIWVIPATSLLLALIRISLLKSSKHKSPILLAIEIAAST